MRPYVVTEYIDIIDQYRRPTGADLRSLTSASLLVSECLTPGIRLAGPPTFALAPPVRAVASFALTDRCVPLCVRPLRARIWANASSRVKGVPGMMSIGFRACRDSNCIGTVFVMVSSLMTVIWSIGVIGSLSDDRCGGKVGLRVMVVTI